MHLPTEDDGDEDPIGATKSMIPSEDRPLSKTTMMSEAATAAPAASEAASARRTPKRETDEANS